MTTTPVDREMQWYALAWVYRLCAERAEASTPGSGVEALTACESLVVAVRAAWSAAPCREVPLYFHFALLRVMTLANAVWEVEESLALNEMMLQFVTTWCATWRWAHDAVYPSAVGARVVAQLQAKCPLPCEQLSAALARTGWSDGDLCTSVFSRG